MTAVTDRNQAINQLADRYWDGVLERSPVSATVLGDDRFDDRLPDLGPVGRAAEAAANRAALAEAEALGGDGLGVEEVITRDMLMLVAANGLEYEEQKLYQLAINHIFGVQTMPVQVAQYQVADTPEKLDKLLARYAAYGTVIGQTIETLREGMAEGRTAASVPVRKEIEQIERMLALPSQAFPAVGMARVADDAARERVRAAIESDVYPALQQLRDFLVNEYEARARTQPGLLATPNGEAAYRLSIRLNTTLDATPDEVHRFGLEDLAHIEAEMDEVARAAGFRDRHAHAKALAEDSANHTDSPEAIIELAREQTARAFAAAPKHFGRIPSANCEVAAVEAYREREAPPAFYMPPSMDGSRQGRYYLNTYQPHERQLHKIAAITFHEATPGHHFQLTIEQELTGLPRFRTFGSRMVGTAYAEGWGLYTERLADEMGLYLTDAERRGMLETQAFRAARLVVDTGLHAFGWSRERAIEFMAERGALPAVDAEIEADRYTIWPGQALAYKIGQREIERARRELNETMGDRFDLRIFHDEVLGHGALPLATLRREIPGWVEAAVRAAEGAPAG
jgi:uncharacterized protein (DUF885 family)